MSKRPLESDFSGILPQIEQSGSSCSWELRTERTSENENPTKVARILPEFVTVTVTTEEPELTMLNMLVDIPCSASISWIQLFNLYVPGLVINIQLYEIKSKWGKIVIGLHTKVEDFMAFSKRPPTNIKVRVVKIIPYQSESNSAILQSAFQAICQNANIRQDQSLCGPNGMEITPFRIEAGANHGLTTQIDSTVPLKTDPQLTMLSETINNSTWKPLLHETQSESLNPRNHIDHSFDWKRTLENEETMDYNNSDEGHSQNGALPRSGTEPTALMSALLGHGYKGVIQIPKPSYAMASSSNMNMSQSEKKPSTNGFLEEMFDEDTEEMIMPPEPDNIVDNNNNADLVATTQAPFPAFSVKALSPTGSEMVDGNYEYDIATEGTFEEYNEHQEMAIQKVRIRRSESVSSIDSGNSDLENL